MCLQHRSFPPFGIPHFHQLLRSQCRLASLIKSGKHIVCNCIASNPPDTYRDTITFTEIKQQLKQHKKAQVFTAHFRTHGYMCLDTPFCALMPHKPTLKTKASIHKNECFFLPVFPSLWVRSAFALLRLENRIKKMRITCSEIRISCKSI